MVGHRQAEQCQPSGANWPGCRTCGSSKCPRPQGGWLTNPVAIRVLNEGKVAAQPGAKGVGQLAAASGHSRVGHEAAQCPKAGRASRSAACEATGLSPPPACLAQPPSGPNQGWAGPVHYTGAPEANPLAQPPAGRMQQVLRARTLWSSTRLRGVNTSARRAGARRSPHLPIVWLLHKLNPQLLKALAGRLHVGHRQADVAWGWHVGRVGGVNRLVWPGHGMWEGRRGQQTGAAEARMRCAMRRQFRGAHARPGQLWQCTFCATPCCCRQARKQPKHDTAGAEAATGQAWGQLLGSGIRSG